MSGFIAMHREAFSHPVLKDGERFRAWFWLVAHAAWKPTRHDARGHTITVERGQICAGREQLAKAWGWSPSAVERFLTRLETEQMIERQTGQMKTVITICNYDKYQSEADAGGHMSGQQTGQKPDRNRTAKEEGNKGTREEEPNGSPSPSRARRVAGAGDPPKFRMTVDWRPAPLPDSVRALTDLWPPGRLEREIEQFRDYWLDRTDKRPGWDRTFHTRIRDVHDRVMRENTNGRPIRTTGSTGADRRCGDGFTRALDRVDEALRGDHGLSGWPAGALG